jgi:flagellin-specific chaperone FliS
MTLFETYFGAIAQKRQGHSDNDDDNDDDQKSNRIDSDNYAQQLKEIVRALRRFLSTPSYFGSCWDRARARTRFHMLDQETYEMHPSLFNPIEAQLIKAHKHRADAHCNTLDKKTRDWFQREWNVPESTSAETVDKCVETFLNLFQHFCDVLNWAERRRLQHTEYPDIFPEDDLLLDDTCSVVLACLDYLCKLYEWLQDRLYDAHQFDHRILQQINDALQALVREFGQSTHETQQQAQHNLSLPGVRNQTDFPHIQPKDILHDIQNMCSGLQLSA